MKLAARQVRNEVEAEKRAGYDFVKVHGDLPRSFFTPARSRTARSRAVGAQLTVPGPARAARARPTLRGGADAIRGAPGGDPLAGGDNVSPPEGVMLAGRWFSQKELQEKLAAVSSFSSGRASP
jgi:hypothetical protein